MLSIRYTFPHEKVSIALFERAKWHFQADVHQAKILSAVLCNLCEALMKLCNLPVRHMWTIDLRQVF